MLNGGVMICRGGWKYFYRRGLFLLCILYEMMISIPFFSRTKAEDSSKQTDSTSTLDVFSAISTAPSATDNPHSPISL